MRRIPVDPSAPSDPVPRLAAAAGDGSDASSSTGTDARRRRTPPRTSWRIVGAACVALGAAAIVDAFPRDNGPPVRDLDPPEHDFGLVAVGENPVVLRTTLRFANHGGGDVRLEGAAGTCGCTAVTPSAKSMAPGEELDIEVVMTLGAAGRKSSIVQVAFDNGQVFMHRVSAQGTRTVSARVIGDAKVVDDGLEMVLLVTAEGDDAPPAPEPLDRGVVRRFDGWRLVGGERSARPPHHWMGVVVVGPATRAQGTPLVRVGNMRVVAP